MNKNVIIKKVLVLTAWLLVISGITILLLAANRKQKYHVCKDVLIGMKGKSDKIYIDKNDILKIIEKMSNGSLLNKSVTAINLAGLENKIEMNPWIKDAELYFDSKDALHVLVEERQPVARVFTSSGNSFYIDSGGNAMPLLKKMSARVPVVTGFPAGKEWNAKNGALMNELKLVANFIYKDNFWNAQVGQIHINANKKFELIPVIGNHIIKLGDAKKINEKLDRLFTFYKQVMSKTGFNKYAALDVQFEGQVVAVNGEAAAVDSIQLQKNIEDFIKRASIKNGDEGMFPDQIAHVNSIKDTTLSISATRNNHVSTKTNPTPIKISKSPTNENKFNPNPKAVMKENEY